jgi:hypothetical protein
MKKFISPRVVMITNISAIILFFSGCQKNPIPPLVDESSLANKSESFISKDSTPPIFKDAAKLFGKPNIVPTPSFARQLISSAYDYSGRLQVSIWAEYFDGTVNHGEVSVDPDFVLIGGGARTSDFSNSNVGINALLTSAYPKDDGTFSKFVADSKDHIVPYNHRLWVYAIGMKMYDLGQIPLDPNLIKANMKLTKAVSSYTAYPTASAIAPSGYTLLSGGAKVNWQGAGNLLTQTMFPTNGINSWTAKSKDHGISSPATIESYCISIAASSMPQFGILEVSGRFGSVKAKAYNSATVNLKAYDFAYPSDPLWLIAGVGGQSAYTGDGRLLYEVYPVDANTGRISDKDHVYPSTGTLYGYIRMIRKL